MSYTLDIMKEIALRLLGKYSGSFPGKDHAGYPGNMADAAHTAEVHRLVDLLPEGQLEALYVLLRSMLPGRDEEPQSSDSVPLDQWTPSPDAPVVRRLSVAGIARGDHDLAERSADILRRELGRPDE